MSNATDIFESGTGHSLHGRLRGPLPRPHQSIAPANQSVLYRKDERGHRDQRRESSEPASLTGGAEIHTYVFADPHPHQPIEDADLEDELDDERGPMQRIQRGVPDAPPELDRHGAPVDRYRPCATGRTERGGDAVNRLPAEDAVGEQALRDEQHVARETEFHPEDDVVAPNVHRQPGLL